jgi:hypothetical protein
MANQLVRNAAVNSAKYLGAYLLLCSLVVILHPLQGMAKQEAKASGAATGQALPIQDGQDSFDFAIGTWKTHVSRRLHPLTGSSTWVEYDGTSVVHKLWDGRANLVELKADGSAGHLELASLRLYDPGSHQWSLNVANSSAGTLGLPTVGGFKDGRGEFYDHETYAGRPIIVRFIISDITRDSAHFEQAFSADDGKTWEVNWVATDTRIADESEERLPGSAI